MSSRIAIEIEDTSVRSALMHNSKPSFSVGFRDSLYDDLIAKSPDEIYFVPEQLYNNWVNNELHKKSIDKFLEECRKESSEKTQNKLINESLNDQFVDNLDKHGAVDIYSPVRTMREKMYSTSSASYMSPTPTVHSGFVCF